VKNAASVAVSTKSPRKTFRHAPSSLIAMRSAGTLANPRNVWDSIGSSCDEGYEACEILHGHLESRVSSWIVIEDWSETTVRTISWALLHQP